MLADQAAVTAEDLRRLITGWRREPARIAAAQYEGTVGVPAVFPRSQLAALAQLRGDQGARALLRRQSDRLVRVPMANAAIDIDTPEDLLRLSESSNAPG